MNTINLLDSAYQQNNQRHTYQVSELNRHHFQTLPACDLLNLTALKGNIYVKSIFCGDNIYVVTILFLLPGSSRPDIPVRHH